MKTSLLVSFTFLVVSLVAILQSPTLGAEEGEKAAALPALSHWQLTLTRRLMAW